MLGFAWDMQRAARGHSPAIYEEQLRMMGLRWAMVMLVFAWDRPCVALPISSYALTAILAQGWTRKSSFLPPYLPKMGFH